MRPAALVPSTQTDPAWQQTMARACSRHAILVVTALVLIAAHAKAGLVETSVHTNPAHHERKVRSLRDPDVLPDNAPEHNAPGVMSEAEPNFPAGHTEPFPAANPYVDPGQQFFTKKTSVDHFGIVRCVSVLVLHQHGATLQKRCACLALIYYGICRLSIPKTARFS